MKYLFLLLFLLPYNVLANDNIIYCSEIEKSGFKANENNGFEHAFFKEDRFKAKINFEKEYFESNDLFMSVTNCFTEDGLESQYPGSTMMTCMTSFGAMFAINKQSLKFTRAAGLGWVYGTDSVVISYGTCEKF